MSDRRKLPFGVGVGSRVDPSGCVGEAYTTPVSRLDPAGSVFSLEWRDHEREAAKERQGTSTGGSNPQLVETLPQADTGKSRDKAGERVACGNASTSKRDHEREAAKERERARKGNQPGASKETLPYLDAGQSRDKAGERVGVSGKAIDLPSKDGILMSVERIE